MFIFFIVPLFFCGKKLPELARSMGEGVRAFNRATNEPTRIVDEKTRKEDEERKAILEAAKKLGIEVEGRDIRDIAQDIVKATQKIESEE